MGAATTTSALRRPAPSLHSCRARAAASSCARACNASARRSHTGAGRSRAPAKKHPPSAILATTTAAPRRPDASETPPREQAGDHPIARRLQGQQCDSHLRQADHAGIDRGRGATNGEFEQAVGQADRLRSASGPAARRRRPAGRRTGAPRAAATARTEVCPVSRASRTICRRMVTIAIYRVLFASLGFFGLLMRDRRGKVLTGAAGRRRTIRDRCQSPPMLTSSRSSLEGH